MLYVMILLSLIVIIYSYNKLLKHDKDIKTFEVIILIIFLGMLYTFFLKDMGKYSLIKIFKFFSEFTMPWFVEFMKS